MLTTLRDYLVSVIAGSVLATTVIYLTILVLTRHVDYDWDARFVAVHDRWDAEGVKPGGRIPDRDAPPRATDW